MMNLSGAASAAHAAQDLIDRGDPAGALALLDQNARDDDADAFAARAGAHLALHDPEAALAAARAALRLDGAHPAAAFNEGRALMALGAPEVAAISFRAAERAFPQVAEIPARLGEAAYLAGDNVVAEAALRRALAQAPGHPVAFALLAELLFQKADQGPLEAFVQDAVGRGGAAAFRAASVLSRLDRRDEALAALANAEAANGPSAATDVLAAELLRLDGDFPRALLRARAAAARAPGDRAAHAPLARLLLTSGAAAEAEAIARRILAVAPFDQLWLALLWTSLAAQRSPEADDLLDLDRDIAAIELTPPAGYPSIAAFNAALAADLAPLHRAAGPPLGQSVHGGSQTRRPLQSVASPAIAAFFREARGAAERFAAALPENPGHPFHRGRQAPQRVTGAWSVRLAPGGSHASHVHPGGWISSAYYVDLPGDADSGADGRGSLALGQPPFPVDALSAPRRLIEPRPGRLALFPSYCWHGTLPFRGPGQRLTIAFDIALANAVGEPSGAGR